MKALVNRTEAWKKVVSFLASFVLAFSLFATPAYAAVSEDDAVAETSTTLALANTDENVVSGSQGSDPEPQTEETLNNTGVAQDASKVDDQEIATAEEATDDEVGEGAAEESSIISTASETGDETVDPQTIPYTLSFTATYDASDSYITVDYVLTDLTNDNVEGIQLSFELQVNGNTITYTLAEDGVTLTAEEPLEISASFLVDRAKVQEATSMAYTGYASWKGMNASDAGSIDLTPSEEATFEVDVTSKLMDQAGEPRSDEYGAIPGETVYFTFTVQNMGAEDLHGVWAEPIDPLVAYGDWNTPVTIPAGESFSFVGYHVVTEDDDLEGEEPGIIKGAATIHAGNAQPKDYALQACKVAKPTYSYQVKYLVGDETVGVYESGNVYGPFVNISEDIMNRYLPEGYAPKEALINYRLVEGEENVITVSYEPKKTDLPYMVRFYKGSIATDNLLGSEKGIGDAGDVVTFDTDFLNSYLPAQGYDPITEEEQLTISLDATENMLMVVYQPQQISYKLSFYRETAQGKELIANYVEEAAYGSTVTFDPDFLNSYQPSEGYLPFDHSKTLDIKANGEDNYLEVVFDRADIVYTVSWYRDNDFYERNRITTQAFTAKYEDTVSIDAALMNQYRPHEGYALFADDATMETYITANPDLNTIHVVYTRDNFPYTVNYYTDAATPENFIDSFTGTAQYGMSVYTVDMNLHLPEGYQRIDERPSIYISADPSRNVLDVVYQKRSDIGYTVKYYRDSVAEGNLLGSDSFDDGKLGADIPYEQGKYLPEGYSATPILDGQTTITANPENNVLNVVYGNHAEYAYYVNYYRDSVDPSNYLGSLGAQYAPYGSEIVYVEGKFVPEGYDASRVNVEGATRVSADESRNVLNVVYTTKAQLTYTVNYYADEVGGQLLNSVVGSGTFGEEIPYTEGAYMPAGYEFGKTEGAPTIGSTPEKSVLNVVYTKASFAYTVNYYRDSISADNLLNSTQDTAEYLSAIPYTNGAYLPEGYAAPGAVSGITTIGYDAAANVLNVVYHPGRYAYTVNYYTGSIDASNLVASITEGGRLYGSTVALSPSELNNQLPEGYEPLTQGVEVQITADSAQNVVNVVFQPDFEAFYAAGISQLNATYNGSKHYVSPHGVVPGDLITYAYQDTTQTRVVGTDANYGAEFTEVTNGDIPVSVTVTRAGITSDALRTIVNIAPAPAEPGIVPDTPVQPGEDFIVDPQAPGNAGGTGLSTADVVNSVVQWVNPALNVPAAAYNAAMALENNDTVASDDATDESTIEDDLNPLASSPLSTNHSGSSDTNSGPIGYLFLVLSVVFAGVVLALFLLRRRMIDRIDALKGATLAVEQYKVKHIVLYIIGSGLFAVAFYTLWVIFKI